MRRLPLLLGAAALAALASLTACGNAAPAATVPTIGSFAPPASPVRVDAPTFASAVATPGVVTLDVRTPEEYAAGHLAGAVNLDVTSPGFASALAALDPQLTYAVYCRSGNRSQVAVAALQEAGLPTTT